MKRKYNYRTIKSVVKALNAAGLKVYGPAMDLETGHESDCGFMDYAPEDVVKYLKLPEAE